MGVTVIATSIVSAIAIVVIAIYTVTSYRLSSRIKSSDDEFRQQVSDLFKAIVISNIITFPKAPTSAIKEFKNYFEQAGGKTRIFK